MDPCTELLPNKNFRNALIVYMPIPIPEALPVVSIVVLALDYLQRVLYMKDVVNHNRELQWRLYVLFTYASPAGFGFIKDEVS